MTWDCGVLSPGHGFQTGNCQFIHTGGPLLTRFSLPQIPLLQTLAYVRARGGFLR